MMYFWIFILSSTAITTSSAIEYEHVVLRAVRGCDAKLPCGQGKVFLDGPNSYVVWLKNNGKFVRRYPTEDKTKNEAVQIQAAGSFGVTCDEEACTDPTSLELTQVDEHDEGFYQCRVHYQATSAVDFIIELRLVESPGMPKIVDVDGIDVSGSVRTLLLGSNMTLMCDIDDVHDKSGIFLWWERNGKEIARVGKIQDGVLRTMVQVINATRDEIGAHYVCLAQNSDVTEPLTASIVINMHLPPKSVEIRLNNNPDFEAGQPRVVDCVVVGSMPPPAVTWHLGDSMLKPSLHKEIHNGDYTVSSLTLSPFTRDDKRELKCRAHNAHFVDTFEDKVVINVGYRPTCVHEQEKMIGYVPNQVESVTCTVEANPEPMQFSWTFADTRTLYTTVKPVPGYQHHYSSTLTWIPQDQQQGELLCRAVNHVGEQKRPCVFPIVAGGTPLAPTCKTSYDMDPNAMKIICKKGWDGGRPQIIHLELQRDGNTLQNVSDRVGIFALPMIQEENVTAVVYSSNSRGRSDAKILTLTPNDTDAKADKKKVPKDKLSVGAIVIEVVVGGIAGTAFVFGLLIYFNKRSSPPPSFTTATADAEAFPMTSNGSYRRQPPLGPTVPPQHYRVGSHTIMRVPGSVTCYTTPTKAGRILGFSTPTTMSPARALDLASDSETVRESYFV